MRPTSREIAHRVEITIHPLAQVEPALLALMACEHLSLVVDHLRDIDEQLRNDRISQSVAVAVRLGVVNRYVLFGDRPWGIDGKIRHAPAKRGRHGEAAGVRVVFHVVLR